jgi:hypothetical protein
VGHVAHMRDEKCIQNFWSENLKGRNHLEHLGINEKIILEWILWRLNGKMWSRCIPSS